MIVDSWVLAEEFFAGFLDLDEPRGWMSQVNLSLMRSAGPQWEATMECHAVMGFAIVFSPRGAPYSDWVRAEPQVSDGAVPTVNISLLTCHPFKPGTPSKGTVIAGDVCRVTTAPAVVESFLEQIDQPTA